MPKLRQTAGLLLLCLLWAASPSLLWCRDAPPLKLGAFEYPPFYWEELRVDRVASDFLNYKKLLAGRIDIFPGNEIVARGLFKKHPEFRGKFLHSDRSFIEWVLRMGISPCTDDHAYQRNLGRS